MSASSLPFRTRLVQYLAAKGAAATGTTTVGPIRRSGLGKIVSLSLTPEANVTGATATARTFTVYNKGPAGALNRVLGTLVLGTGNDLVAYVPKTIPLSGTVADLEIAQGDVIVCTETVAGAGTAHSGGVLEVTIGNSATAEA
jgi:hypothetical protein